MAQQKFIAKPSVGSKNSSKGNKAEALYSLKYHENNIPILLSGLVLRSYQCGQVDVCYLKHKIIYIVEVKSSSIGKELIGKSKQGMRLTAAADFLSQLLDVKTRIISVAQKENFAKCRIPH